MKKKIAILTTRPAEYRILTEFAAASSEVQFIIINTNNYDSADQLNGRVINGVHVDRSAYFGEFTKSMLNFAKTRIK